MSRLTTNCHFLLVLMMSLLLSSCSEEALAGLVAGSVAVYVIGAIILFILVILALIDLYKKPYPLNKKLMWLLIILIIPYIGAILYFAVGRSSTRSVT